MYFPHKALNSTSVLDLGAILYSEITHAIIQNTEMWETWHLIDHERGTYLQQHKLHREGSVTFFSFSRGHVPPLED